VVVGAVVAHALVAGCTQVGQPGDTGGAVQDVVAQQHLAKGAAEVLQASLIVNPPNGANGVSPTERVTAVVIGGQPVQVELSTRDGAKLGGILSPDGERWNSTEPLRADTSYVLTAVIRDTVGKQWTSVTTFSTWAPGQRVTATISPKSGETVGSNEPVSIVFDEPVRDRAAVERALRIIADRAVPGRTEWHGDRRLIWRPSSGWPSGCRVTVSLDIFGKQLAPGRYGAADLRTTFQVAESARSLAAGTSRTASPRPESAAKTRTRSNAPRPGAAAVRARAGGETSAARRPHTRSRPPTSARARPAEKSSDGSPRGSNGSPQRSDDDSEEDSPATLAGLGLFN
jgi:hypothetical protein